MANYGYQGAYSTTNYGAQAGAQEGGGFMSGSQQGSQENSSKTYGQESLRPVTIKQIIDAQQPHPEAEFKIDGSDLTQISFIGQINSVTKRATNILYKLDDGTGLIEVMQWVNSDVDPDTVQPTAKEGEYLRIFGRLRSFNNKRSVTAHMIRPITDFNEVSYHLLEATAIHLYFVRGPPDSINDGGVKADPGTGMFVDSYDGAANGAMGASAKKLPAKMSAGAKTVFGLLQSAPQSNEGLHVHSIAAQLSMTSNDVFKAGDELLGEGLIYTTVDDETWAVLEY
ncbi:putative replication protein A 32 kDa subunit [Venustampulla echinocandica]|uniref:Putative replication protein A 32 kDa subunit n=1 Tax=Venustampulla echinocandica TaxID=2656787 RepID=A0A370TA32_9HELO|nr:putative replication protein A 32 kDa subunit [Venustampulla echinocandica]RDL30677.1 putative replication protein A 32 kDa subunit [Venustampulla echinocandica]